MSEFQFLYPWRLTALLLCPLLVLLARRGRSAWHRIMDKPFDTLIVGSRYPLSQMLPWLFALGVLALAGPSWQKVLPAGMTPHSNVMVILQQDPAMLAQDLPPSRHQRMQIKLQRLLSRLPGSHAGLVVYRHAAFLTTPLTSDPAFFNLFLDAQQPQQLPEGDGSGLQSAVALALKNLPQASESPRTLLLVADTLTPEDARWLAQQQLPLQLWVPGTARGGALPQALSEQGIDTRLNVPRFEQLRNNGVPVTLATAEDDDLQAVIGNIQQTVTQQQNARHDLHWKNSGYLLVIPMLLLLLFWQRQLLCVTLLLVPLLGYSPPGAAAWLDAWVTPDKQGQIAFDRGDYQAAAQHFNDPLRRGIALYYAGDFAAASAAFRQAPASAETLLWAANSDAQQKQWQQALNGYDMALSLRPGWDLALNNRSKVAQIIMQLRQKERERAAEQSKEANYDPDAIQHDLKKDQGVAQQDMQPVAGNSPQLSQWYDNLTLSPAGLLENLYHAAPQEAP